MVRACRLFKGTFASLGMTASHMPIRGRNASDRHQWQGKLLACLTSCAALCAAERVLNPTPKTMTAPSSMAPSSGASLPIEGVRIRFDARMDDEFMVVPFTARVSSAAMTGQADAHPRHHPEQARRGLDSGQARPCGPL